MATENVNPSQQQSTDAGHNAASDDVRPNYDRLLTVASQLTALLELTHGYASESFCSMDEWLRNDYLEACAHMAAECKELLTNIAPFVYRGAPKPKEAGGA